MIGLRLAKLISINYQNNTVDVLMQSHMGIMRHINVAFPLATTQTGVYEMPVLKTVGNKTGYGTDPAIPNLFERENVSSESNDLDDPNSNYAYAVLVGLDEQHEKIMPVCIGFIFPHRNAMIFDPEHPPSSPTWLRDAVKQLKGALVHRTNSGVYWTVDLNGNLEYAHPNGSFFRLAEGPTMEQDGTIHVDLTGKNTRGADSNVRFDPKQTKGADDKKNTERYVYGHLEVKTKKGVVEIDINRDTGNVTIKTPQNSSDATGASNNKLTIVAGGDALLQSVKGDVKIESVGKQIFVTAQSRVTVETKSNADSSILLAPSSEPDYLPLFTALAKKFNAHKHVCTGSGKPTSASDQQLKQGSDSTNVTKAG